MAQTGRETEKTALITSSSLPSGDKDGRTLRKSLGCPQMFAYIVSLLIGSGVYISPGLVADNSNNMGTALAIWIASGLISLFGSLCFCELAVALKKTGGQNIFIKEIYGDFAGFFTVWAFQIIISPVVLAVISFNIGQHIVGSFTDITAVNGIWKVKGIAVLCIFISFLINVTSTSFTSKTQTFFTSLQIISIFFFILVGIYKAATGGIENYKTMFTCSSSAKTNFSALGLAFYGALWSYDCGGFVPTVTEELKNRNRDLWLSIVTGIPFVIICYVLMNLAFMSALSHQQIADSSIVAMTFIEKSLGAKVVLIVPIIVAVTCFGSLNANNFFLSRGILSAAREGHLPEPMAYIHKERRTPIPALLALFLQSSVIVLALGSKTLQLVTYFGFAIWITYGLTFFGVIILRIRQPDLPRPFKVWMVNPILMSLISASLVLAPLFQLPVECSICVGILLLSVPLYFIAVRRSACMSSGVSRFKERVYRFIKWRFALAMCIFVDDHQVDVTVVTNNDSVYDSTMI